MIGYPNVSAPQREDMTVKARQDGFTPTPELRYRAEMFPYQPGGWSSVGMATSSVGGWNMQYAAVSVLQQRWVKEGGEERWLDVPHA